MYKFGILLTLAGIYLGVQLGSGIKAFVDVPALLFVVVVGFGILIASHGLRNVLAFVSTPFRRSERSDGKINDNLKRIAETGITAFVAAGWIGSLIGVVQLLSALDDPSQLGIGAAIALLTAFYGYLFAYAICFPITRSRLN